MTGGPQLTMKRTVKSVSLGDGGKRHMVRIEDRPLKPGEELHRRKIEFLQELLTDGVYAGLLNCGPVPFETMRVLQNGSQWVVLLEAEEVQ